MKPLSVMLNQYMWRFCIVIYMSIFLTGCISIGGDAEPVQLFRLAPIIHETNNTAKPLQVDVSSGNLLNSQNLWVVQPGHRIAGYKGARWAMPLPELWEQALIRSLEQSNVAIVVDSGGKYASLKVALRDYQVEIQENNATIKIALQATFNGLDGEVTHQLFDASANASLSDAVSLSKAFNLANQGALQKLIQWVSINGT